MQQKKIKKIDFRSRCPISSALDIVGDRWSLLIIRDLIFYQKKTFSGFAQSSEGIASNILSDRLNRLEEMGILSKGKLPRNKKTNIYSLTERGIDFLPIIVEYILWSAKHLPHHIASEAREFARAVQQDKEGVVDGIRKKLMIEAKSRD